MAGDDCALGTVKDRHRLKGLGWSIRKVSVLGLTWNQAGDGARAGVDMEAEMVVYCSPVLVRHLDLQGLCCGVRLVCLVII